MAHSTFTPEIIEAMREQMANGLPQPLPGPDYGAPRLQPGVPFLDGPNIGQQEPPEPELRSGFIDNTITPYRPGYFGVDNQMEIKPPDIGDLLGMLNSRASSQYNQPRPFTQANTRR